MDKKSSINEFLSSLIVNLSIAMLILVAFVLLRKRNQTIYEPKSLKKHKTLSPLNNSYLGWIWKPFTYSKSELLDIIGLDAYMFLKFMKLGSLFFFVFSVLGCLILIPLNLSGHQGADGMDTLTIKNIKSGGQKSWVHFSLAILLIVSTVVLFFTSMDEYVQLRQEYLTNNKHKYTVKARTILVSGIHKDKMNLEYLTSLFNTFDTGVQQIHLIKNYKNLYGVIKDRDQAHYQLELACTKYINNSIKANSKNTRPTHKSNIFGRSVDSIETYSHSLNKANRIISILKKSKEEFEYTNSAYVLFNTQLGAHLAAQCLLDHKKLCFLPIKLETVPNDIVWENISIGPYSRIVRNVVGLILCLLIAIFWAIPVSLSASLSDLEGIYRYYTNKAIPIPSAVLGPLQGVLPTIILTIFVILVPIIYQQICLFQGHITKGDVQLSLMSKYYWFLVLTVLFSSTLASKWSETQRILLSFTENINGAVEELGSSLPSASTFFITYFLLRSLVTSSMQLLQIPNLLFKKTMAKFFVTTPRQLLGVYDLPSITWGVIWAENTFAFTLGIVYCVIAPFSAIFAALYFIIFCFIYQYQMLYVYDTDESGNGGVYFVNALRHLFFGLYIFQIMFISLTLSRSNQIQSGLLVMVLFLTIVAHINFNRIYHPLIEFLPADTKFQQQGPEDKSKRSISFISVEQIDYQTYFEHPVIKENVPKLWVPEDEYGYHNEVGRMIAESLKHQDIESQTLQEVTVNRSKINQKGKIELNHYEYPEQVY